jgi:hypothetical protein
MTNSVAATQQVQMALPCGTDLGIRKPPGRGIEVGETAGSERAVRA